jgi:hypothetical protein
MASFQTLYARYAGTPGNNSPSNVLRLLFLLVLAVFLFLAGRGCQKQADDVVIAQQEADLRLARALQDKLRTERDSQGHVRTEKLTLQGSDTQLAQVQEQLTASQRALLATVRAYKKDEKKSGRKLIAAGRVETAVSLGPGGIPFIEAEKISPVDTLIFVYKSDSLNYQATVWVKEHQLVLDALSLPNVATVAFSYNEKEPGVPVAFSITNSNPLFRTANVESYAIEGLRPGKKGKTKVGLFLRKLGRDVLFFLGGAVVGRAIGYERVDQGPVGIHGKKVLVALPKVHLVDLAGDSTLAADQIHEFARAHEDVLHDVGVPLAQ